MKQIGLAIWAALLLASCSAPSNSESAAATTTAETDVPAARTATHSTSALDTPPPASSAPSVDLAEIQRQLDAAKAALELNPGDPAAARAFAIALYSSGDQEAAVKRFETLAQDAAGSSRAKLDLALVYNALSRVQDAEKIYLELLGAEPNNTVVLHNLGNLNYKRGDYPEAVEYYQRAITAKPDYMLAHLHLADAYRRQEKFRDAYISYNRVIKIEPTQPQQLAYFDDALYNMASLDLAMGAPQRALQLLQELLAENPEHGKAHYALGKLLLQMGRPADAEQAFANHMRILEREQSGATAAMVE